MSLGKTLDINGLKDAISFYKMKQRIVVLIDGHRFEPDYYLYKNRIVYQGLIKMTNRRRQKQQKLNCNISFYLK